VHHQLRPLHGALELEGHMGLREPPLLVRAGPEGEDPFPPVLLRLAQGVPGHRRPQAPGQAGALEALLPKPPLQEEGGLVGRVAGPRLLLPLLSDLLHASP